MSYGEDLTRKLSSTIIGNKEVQNRDKFTKREVAAMITRHLLGLAVGFRNSEFDILVTLKVTIVMKTKKKYIVLTRILQPCSTWRSKLILKELKNYIQMV